MSDRDLLHAFKNHLSIITGFCDLLIAEVPAGSPARHDIMQIRTSSEAALKMLPELARRLGSEGAPPAAPGVDDE